MTPEAHAAADAPSMLDLVRLSPRLLFPPGGRELYRQIALLADLDAEDEVLVAGCGNGVSLEYFVTEYGVHGCGVDADADVIAAAEDRARARELASSMQFQHSSADKLPYRDEIFDVAVGELGLTHESDPATAVRELVRVTRSGGCIVLVQPVWKAPVDEPRQGVLARHLGVRPLMLVEWKRLLRENGLGDLHTEDWTDAETAFRSSVAKPFPDFAELFTLSEKIGILRRAWGRWGWKGVKTVLVREREVHRLLTRERILGLDLLKGVRPVEEVNEPVTPEPSASDEPAPDEPEPDDPAPEPEPDEVAGLPLFSGDEEQP
jgi:ubiquinone/menaquinone biosynthesis C-methylase UbiE